MVLRVLASGPKRYSDFRKHIPGISDRLLTKRLCELVDQGLVLKGDNDGEGCYGLSERGAGLLPALEAIDQVAHLLDEDDDPQADLAIAPVPAT